MKEHPAGTKGTPTTGHRSSLPGAHTLDAITGRFSLTERLLFIGFLIVALIGVLLIIWDIQRSFIVTVPAYDGTLIEGMVGTPGPINPLLASSAPDRALTSLVYSGLMKADPEGSLTHELSEQHSVSEDGTEYTFILRDDVLFHDGESVTADDVVFTVEKAKDPAVRSDLQADWSGIDVRADDERTVVFSLSEPQEEFMELTTLGILPEHIWRSVDSNRFAFSVLNTEPIGSGPYKIDSITYEQNNPERYTLKANEDYVRGKPYIATLQFPFFDTEREALQALQRGEINALSGISPERAEFISDQNTRVHSTPLPRVFAIFINQNNNEALADRDVRAALSRAIDRERIVSELLHGHGTALTGPLPPGKNEAATNSPEDDEDGSPEELLREAGWEYDEELGGRSEDGESILSIEITTVTNEDLMRAVEIVKQNWAHLGVEVDTAFYGATDLNQNVLRPREFEGLLFGYILDRDFDLYPYWHSSQRNDPGMNMSLYTDITVDGLLEDLRNTSDPEEREELRTTVGEHIRDDVPAFFLYAPNFIYAVPESLENAAFGHLPSAEERFLNIHEWIIETDTIWSFLL